MGKAETEVLRRGPCLSAELIGPAIVFLSQQRVHQNCLLGRSLGITLLLPPGFSPTLYGLPTSGPPYVLATPYHWRSSRHRMRWCRREDSKDAHPSYSLAPRAQGHPR